MLKLSCFPSFNYSSSSANVPGTWAGTPIWANIVPHWWHPWYLNCATRLYCLLTKMAVPACQPHALLANPVHLNCGTVPKHGKLHCSLQKFPWRWHRSYYQRTSRELVSPVSEIFGLKFEIFSFYQRYRFCNKSFLTTNIVILVNLDLILAFMSK